MLSSPSARSPSGKTIGGIGWAWNELENHDALTEAQEAQMKAAVREGSQNIICVSGNRRGMDDETGMKNCAKGLKQIMPTDEKLGRIISMELLNSKVNHKDFMCDHTEWGADCASSLTQTISNCSMTSTICRSWKAT